MRREALIPSGSNVIGGGVLQGKQWVNRLQEEETKKRRWGGKEKGPKKGRKRGSSR